MTVQTNPNVGQNQENQNQENQDQENQDQEKAQDHGQRSPNLARRYGHIGIAALAAALLFSASAKDPTDAPMASQFDERFIERGI